MAALCIVAFGLHAGNWAYETSCCKRSKKSHNGWMCKLKRNSMSAGWTVSSAGGMSKSQLSELFAFRTVVFAVCCSWSGCCSVESSTSCETGCLAKWCHACSNVDSNVEAERCDSDEQCRNIDVVVNCMGMYTYNGDHADAFWALKKVMQKADAFYCCNDVCERVCAFCKYHCYCMWRCACSMKLLSRIWCMIYLI